MARAARLAPRARAASLRGGRLRRLARPVAALLLATFALQPAAVAAESARPVISNPDLFDKSLEAAKEAIEHYGAWEDKESMRRVADIGYRVTAAGRFEKFPISFYLADMREPNAFALPGGQVFVTRGMIELGLSDDMLAALLGHEVAHVVLEHGSKLQKRATLLNILSQAALLGVLLSQRGGGGTPGVPTYGPGPEYTSDRSGARIQGAAAASLILPELLLRSYSREFEDQADEEGQRMAAAAGFDPMGGQQLFDLMRQRLPQSHAYGYWRTHPFFDERVTAAEARGRRLRSQDARPADDFRIATQATLLAYDPHDKDKEDPRRGPGGPQGPNGPGGPGPGGPGGPGPGGPLPGEDPREPVSRFSTLRGMLEQAALTAWPQGEVAERLRLEELHRQRDAVAGRLELQRDYGKVIALYDEQMEEVRALTPQSPFLAKLDQEAAAMRAELAAAYPRAQAVLAGTVYQTGFLETFASNYPKAPEIPRVALELAGAYARMGRQTDAVDRYLEAWQADPKGPTGERAIAGMRSLATVVQQLTPLQRLAEEVQDPELQRLAGGRLAQLAGSFKDLANGADYLKRFPDGTFAEQVAKRMDSVADSLYGEVVLYQGVGDAMKALDRINLILTHAPLSPAADRIRERAVLES